MTTADIFIVFPHQLFRDISPLQACQKVYLVEEYLFFNQYKFHKQKLVLHRASMHYYADYLRVQGIDVVYVEAISPESDIQLLIEQLPTEQASSIHYYDVCDNWLERRLRQSCQKRQLPLCEHKSPMFINSKEDLGSYFGQRNKFFQTDFYIYQRKRLQILVQEQDKPLGGKWSFDVENRKKYPKGKQAPPLPFLTPNAYTQEAIAYVAQHYPNNYGLLPQTENYPCTHQQSEDWLQQFLAQRFAEFGAYEDALVAEESVLHHSVLTPMLNIGLLLPMQVVQAALDYADQHPVPLSSLEGFIRQIIGWREYIRAVYVYKGSEERTRNFWQWHKKMPQALYKGQTGIAPVDHCIHKLLRSGYNHHIERLMVLGNFMLLNEIQPDEVYRWFMELYIDAYDWVMVPNVYGMSQFADGGLMATKPYVSGSSYLLKMSNYPKGDWCAVWDALFWRFMAQQRHFFLANPRLGMLVHSYDKMSADKKQAMAEVLSNYQLH